MQDKSLLPSHASALLQKAIPSGWPCICVLCICRDLTANAPHLCAIHTSPAVLLINWALWAQFFSTPKYSEECKIILPRWYSRRGQIFAGGGRGCCSDVGRREAAEKSRRASSDGKLRFQHFILQSNYFKACYPTDISTRKYWEQPHSGLLQAPARALLKHVPRSAIPRHRRALTTPWPWPDTQVGRWLSYLWLNSTQNFPTQVYGEWQASLLSAILLL